VSKEDAWGLVSSLIALTDLTRFHDVAPRVLDELDPALDVPLERRFMAAAGKPRTWSPRLRQGIADTTAFLGGYATDEVLRDRLTGKLRARRVVAAVAGNANADATGRAWQSLTDVLPLLAEASPETFLDAVDTDLRRDEPLLRSLFLDSQLATFGTSSLHFSLIWALESLAWCGDHMSAAAHALARLAAILVKSLTIRGLIQTEFAADLMGELLERATPWVRDGSLQHKKDIVDGLENAPEAFLGMLDGKDFGKLLVPVS
jgi:hypothetical protein